MKIKPLWKTVVLSAALLSLLLAGCQGGTSQPETALDAYVNALIEKDYVKAAEGISDFSLEFSGITREEAANTLNAASTNENIVVEHSIGEIRMVGSSLAIATISLSTQYQQNPVQKQETKVALMKEKGQWKVNWGNVLDEREITSSGQTVRKVTVQPVKMVRYVDRVQVHFNTKNDADMTVYWGFLNDPIGTLTYAGESALKAVASPDSGNIEGPVFVESNAASELIIITFFGMRSTAPATLELTGWTVNPNGSSGADPSEVWSYSFDLK